VGWIGFAATIMVLLGAFHVIQGLVAIFNQDYYRVDGSGLVVTLDLTTWGWVHLVGGVVVIGAGFCIFAGQVWARAVGVALAMVSAVVSVGFLPAYPLLALIMIGLDVVVILALTVHGSEVKD